MKRIVPKVAMTPGPKNPETELRHCAQFVVDLYNSSEVDGMSWGAHSDKAIAALESALAPTNTDVSPSQRDRTESILTGLRIALPRGGLRAAADELDQIIGEAQNRPPLGKADGSMSNEYWSEAQHVRTALYTLVRCLYGNLT